MSYFKYIPNFVPDRERVFEKLWTELDWEKRSEARIEYWTNIFNRSYTYGSGIGVRTYESRKSHPDIDYVKNLLSDELKFSFEGCFLNGYETGRNALGWHADDDPNIDHNFPIAVVTVGDGRNIDFMKKDDKSSKESIFLEPGSLLLMNAGMQSTHFHRIPKAGFVVKKPRISLTFRKLI